MSDGIVDLFYTSRLFSVVGLFLTLAALIFTWFGPRGKH